MLAQDTFQSFFDFAESYFFVLKDDLIQEVNKTFCSQMGFEKGDVIQKSLFDLLLKMDVDRFKSCLADLTPVTAQVVNAKKKAVRVEWSFQREGDFVLVKGKDITEILKHKDRFEQYSVLLRGVNESLERSSHRLFLLQSTLTSTIPYAKDSVASVLNITKQTFRFETAIVTKPKGENLVIDTVVGKNENLVGKVIKNRDCLSYKLFNSTVEIVQPLKKYLFQDDEDHLKNGKFFAGFPIVFNDKRCGTVELIFDEKTTDLNFDNSDIQFLKLIAEVIGRIVELQRINDELDSHAKKLEHKNNELDDFAHIVSHDLKAPLRAIKNLIVFIKDEEDNKLTDESKDDFKLIEQRANRMSLLIEGILQYSRVGREESPTSEFELQTLVEEVVEQLKPMNGAAEFSVANDFPKLVTKELFMFQTVSNLVSNAIKYNDKPKPMIRIGGRQNGDKYIFWVEDNGPGIPEQYRERVFGVFETLQGRDEVESTGIGLTIVQKMTNLMGGSVKIEDSDLGGAKFIIDFSMELN